MKRFACFLVILTSLLTCFTMPFAACANNSAVPSHEYLVLASTDGGLKITGFNPQTLPEDVVIPEKIGGKAVVEIGRLAFSECETITSAYISDSVKEIGKNAFYRCKKLKKVTLPEGLKKISEYCFSACSSLSSINLPDSVETIGEYAFSGSKIGAIKMPASLKTIKEYAFLYCLRLQTSIPDGVSVGEYAFDNAHEQMPTSANSFTITDKIMPGTYSFGESTIYTSFISAPETWKNKSWYNKDCQVYFYYGCEMGYDENTPYVLSVALEKKSSDIQDTVPTAVIPIFSQSVFPLQPPYRYGYKFWGWSTTKGATKADFTELFAKLEPNDDGILENHYYYVKSKGDEKIYVPFGTTLYVVWQELDENGSVLIPL